MRYILLLLPFVYIAAPAQQKESNVSISCYVNPELYLQASVIAYVSDKAGNVSCIGKYITISNKSGNSFYYKLSTNWTEVKPQQRTVILASGVNNTPSKSASVLMLNVRYHPVAPGNIDTKVRAMAQMNAQSDRVKAYELGGDSKTSNEALAKIRKPLDTETSATPPAKATKKDVSKRAAVHARPKASPKQGKTESALKKKQATQKVTFASSTAVGLRIDFGNGTTGIGPNVKHRFNRNSSIDASLLFFEGDWVGLNAQFEHNFPMKRTAGLNWYIGIGPQFLFNDEKTTTSLVPVTGLEYNIPGAPLNFALDWRPNFSLSSHADVEAGRFGLSFRYAF